MNYQDFFYVPLHYQGEFKPENVVFNANLQEFSQKVNYICNLETAGKITPEGAYQNILTLWEQLKHSKTELDIGKNL